MKRKNVISRLTTLVLATVACLLLVLLLPVFFAHRASDEPFSGSSVMASPRDLHVVTAPIQLSVAPDLVLSRGALYADGNVAAGLPISRFVLDGPVFTLNASGLKATSLDFDSGAVGAALAPLVEQLAAMGFDTLVVQRGTLYVSSVDGASETLSEVEAELSGRRKNVITARGSFKVRGQRLKFEGSLLQTTTDKSAPLRWPLKVSIKGGLLEANLDGHVDVAEDLQLAGQTEIATSSVRRAARWFGVPIPTASGLNAATLKGQFTWGRHSLAIENAKITVDGNEASGALALNVAGERPLVDGTLAFTALDLTPYVEAMRSQSFVFERLTSSWSEYDLVLPILKHVDADLRVSAPKIVLNGKTLGRGAAAITVRAGKLIADIAELELAGGRATAQVTADSGELVPRYAIRGRVENFEAGPATAALFGPTLLSGRSTLVVDVASFGQTPVEVLRRLSGKAALTMPEGGKLALDTKALRAAAKAGMGPSTGPGWGDLAKGQTNLDPVEVRAILQGGEIFLDAVRGTSGSVGLGATGHVDLVEKSLDVAVSVKSNVPTDRPLVPADLTGGDSISLRGAWREPTVRTQDAAPTGDRPN